MLLLHFYYHGIKLTEKLQMGNSFLYIFNKE